MKTYLYGVRDCHNNAPYLLRSFFSDYQTGDFVSVLGHKLRVETRAIETPGVSKLTKLEALSCFTITK